MTLAAEIWSGSCEENDIYSRHIRAIGSAKHYFLAQTHHVLKSQVNCTAGHVWIYTLSTGKSRHNRDQIANKLAGHCIMHPRRLHTNTIIVTVTIGQHQPRSIKTIFTCLKGCTCSRPMFPIRCTHAQVVRREHMRKLGVHNINVPRKILFACIS